MPRIRRTARPGLRQELGRAEYARQAALGIGIGGATISVASEMQQRVVTNSRKIQQEDPDQHDQD